MLTQYKNCGNILLVAGTTAAKKKDINNRIEKIVRSYENNKMPEMANQ
ncbi:hypothetical protein RFV38_09480 [Cetobacterium sp. C33]|uniref:Uncharacterized protein n=1 Tax=Candidatus Cetobacterium colombiensis TaxID=3073100 RepID=A0ABU4WB09_9FUSO|nr:hypothetical protein [Candidatus Cetobacterium colombiensis]